MCHDDRRCSDLALQVPQVTAEAGTQRRIERRERLVEQYQADRSYEGTRQRHSLLLAEGQRCREPVLQIEKAEALEPVLRQVRDCPNREA